MKLTQVFNAETLNEAQSILKVERGKLNDAVGTSLKGKINTPYSTLVKLFGEPEKVFQDENWTQGEANYEWVIEFQHREGLRDYDTEGDDEPDGPYDFDYDTVTIYDRNYEQGTNPLLIKEWNVGAKDNNGYYLLIDYISENQKR